jgi:hypothetical protein
MDDLGTLTNRIKALEKAMERLQTKSPAISGTWTAAFVATTSGTITIDPTLNIGRYVKVGSAVHITGFFNVQSVVSPVGILRVTGLPFAAGIGNPFNAPLAVVCTGLTASATTMIQAAVINSQTYINLYTYASGTVGLTLANYVQANAYFFIAGTYLAAS